MSMVCCEREDAHEQEQASKSARKKSTEAGTKQHSENIGFTADTDGEWRKEHRHESYKYS